VADADIEPWDAARVPTSGCRRRRQETSTASGNTIPPLFLRSAVRRAIRPTTGRCGAPDVGDRAETGEDGRRSRGDVLVRGSRSRLRSLRCAGGCRERSGWPRIPGRVPSPMGGAGARARRGRTGGRSGRADGGTSVLV